MSRRRRERRGGEREREERKREVTVVGLLMAAYLKIDYLTGLELKPD